MSIKRFKNGSIRLSGTAVESFVRAMRGDDKVELFNLKYKPGDRVLVKGDDGSTFVDTVRYPASIMGGHTAVAWLESKGSYLIDRVIGKEAQS